MKAILVSLLMVTSSGAALAQADASCLFKPAELAAALGQTPDTVVAKTDPSGTSCSYRVGKSPAFSARVVAKCDQARFDSHAKLMQSTSGKPNNPLAGIGDGAYFSPGGTAAARVGGRCIQLSGLRAGARREVTADDAAKLLGLAVTRVGN